MADLTRLLADTLIDVSNPFGDKGTERDAAKRMHAALVAVVGLLAEVETTPGLHRITIGRRLREAITTALTTKEPS